MRFWGFTNPGALLQAATECCAFGATRYARASVKRYMDRDCAVGRWPSTHSPKVVRPKSYSREHPPTAQFPPRTLSRAAEGRNGRSARLRVAGEPTDQNHQPGTESWKNKHETNTNLIHHDQRRCSFSVDGRLLDNKQHPEQREHARGRRL